MLETFSHFEFGPYQLDPLNRLLTRNREPVPLAPRVFDTLVTLVRLQGRVVTKDDLLRAVWSGSFVEESNLTVTISALRKALNNGDGRQTYVQTVPKFGYRFVGEVREVVAPEPVLATPLSQTEEKSQSHESGVAAKLPPGGASAKWSPWVLISAMIVLAGFSVASLMAPQTWRSGHGPIKPAAVPASESYPLPSHDRFQSTQQHGSLASTFQRGSCPAEQDAVPPRTRSNEVLALYLKGRYSSSRGTETGLEHGVAYFSKAISKDPCSAPAYAGLADAYLSLPSWSVQSPQVAYRKAAEAAHRALELDRSLSQAHTMLGMLAMIQDWNFSLAEQECRRGVELGPTDPLAHQGLGLYLAARGRLDGALAEMQIAHDLDPLSLDIGMKLGLMLYYLRQYPEAIAEYKKVIDLDPHYSVAHYGLGVTYFVQQNFEGAMRELKESSGLVHDREPLAFGLYTAARARMGDDAAARTVAAELGERSHKEYVSPTSMAVFYIGLGQLDRGLSWVDQMFQDHLLEALMVNVDPLFDPVRSDPRLMTLVRTVNDKWHPAAKPGRSAWLHLPRN